MTTTPNPEPSTPGAITRDQLGHLGGDARFVPPGQDAVSQDRQGVAASTKRVAVYPWWWVW